MASLLGIVGGLRPGKQQDLPGYSRDEGPGTRTRVEEAVSAAIMGAE
jgi:hypothetical protein